MKNGNRIENGFTMVLQAIWDILFTFARQIMSALAYVVAGMIAGAGGGAAVALYSDIPLVAGLIIGAILGLVVVVAVQMLVASGGGW
ncbi:hypothetical protein [Tabrizicola sp.]|uniref:hypothetical protein n=1 Tax=Tabrizicola sp. TaxID=2005166 RepID=UPI002604924A|nr:hypothetical protein [Tabrizicola sp.]MDM7933229.1 hypothetical protein [Tabrizicola sp.]